MVLAAAAVLCSGPAPALAAVSQGEMDAISYEEKVQQSSVGKRQAFLKEVEDDFMTGYAALWESENMEDKLRNSLDRAFETTLGRFQSVKMLWNRDEKVAEIQRAFLDDYQKEYDPFIKKLENSFGEIYLNKLNAYYGTLANLRVTAPSDAPASRMFFKMNVGKTSLGKTLLSGVLVSILYDLFKAPDKLRETMISRYIAYFRDERPREIWTTFLADISAQLDVMQVVMSETDEAVKEFWKSEKYGDLTDQMSPEQRRQFDERLVAVHPLDGSVSYDTIIDNFGSFIAQTQIDDMAPLREVLALGDPFVAKKWLDVAGRSYPELIRALPADVWKKYSLSANSVRVLEWLSKRSLETREALARFTPEEAAWVMDEVPSGYTDLLFNRAHSDDEIRGELKRLERLKKGHRVPWQGSFAYLWHRILYFVVNVYCVYFFVGVAFGVLAYHAVKVLCIRRRNRRDRLGGPPA